MEASKNKHTSDMTRLMVEGREIKKVSKLFRKP